MRCLSALYVVLYCLLCAALVSRQTAPGPGLIGPTDPPGDCRPLSQSTTFISRAPTYLCRSSSLGTAWLGMGEVLPDKAGPRPAALP